MYAGVWIRYLLGQGRAIEAVATNPNAIWTGLALVLLTAIARSYDQTFIGEKPILWLFGPLLFSLVSGTWLYLIVYGWFARWEMDRGTGGRPGFWSGWRGFMGLFWMTAPVAWLYAIPVERFCQPVNAAWANVGLLAVVSLWRVLLMARVVHRLTHVPVALGLGWVTLAAAIEVLVVFIFGGAFSQAILRGMGGMRNSPAEEVLLGAAGTAFMAALWAAPIALVLSLVFHRQRNLRPLPVASPARFEPRSLLVAAACWVGLAVIPQIQLTRNVTVERLVAAGDTRAALDFLSRHQPGDFAPARELPPRAFERSVFEELPACWDAIQHSDPAWLREFLIQRLNETMTHYAGRWHRTQWHGLTEEERINHLHQGIRRYHQKPASLLKLVAGLQRIPEGQTWLSTNTNFIQAMHRVASNRPEPGTEEGLERQAEWLSLSNRVQELFVTNLPAPPLLRAMGTATPR